MERARAIREARIEGARYEPNTFIELVMQDEATGLPIAQADCHEQWHKAISENDRVVLFAHVESGKTNQLTIGRTIWELGRNPNMRIAIVSNTYGQAEKCVRAIGSYITTNPLVQTIFPELRKSEPWTHSVLTVESSVVKKDPSVQAVGVHGNVVGSRLELVIFDDILDFENTQTPKQRRELWDWIQATLIGRLTEDARVIAVGTPWHPDDALHRWEKAPGWKALRFPVLDKAGKSTWPSKWPLLRVDRRRIELGPLEFARQMLCQARDDSTSPFRKEWIDRCLKNGEGCRCAKSTEDFYIKNPIARPDWWSDSDSDTKQAIDAASRLLAAADEGEQHPGAFYTGVDLGVQQHADSDESVLFTIFVGPDRKRQVVEVDAGRWTGPQIVNKIISAHKRFGSIVIVENNAAQNFILQFVEARGEAVPLVPFTTGKSKAHPEFGIECIAAEFAAGAWIVPSSNGAANSPGVDAWLQELLLYTRRSHTGDRLMASWFARELAHRAERAVPEVGVRVAGV